MHVMYVTDYIQGLRVVHILTTVPLQLNRTKRLQQMSLTISCCVHFNVYGLGNVHGTSYLTAVDPILSTSSAVHTYHHVTSGSVKIPLLTITENSSPIGKVPVS